MRVFTKGAIATMWGAGWRFVLQSDADAAIAHLTAERDRLTAENNRLEMQCFAQGQAISALTIERDALKAEADALRSERDTLKSEVENLRMALQAEIMFSDFVAAKFRINPDKLRLTVHVRADGQEIGTDRKPDGSEAASITWAEVHAASRIALRAEQKGDA